MLKPEGGVEWRVTLDPQTSLPKTMVHKEGEQTITVTFDSYETVEGIKFEKEIHRSAGEQAVDQAQRKLAARPEDPSAMAGLATAYLVRARETADPAYYSKADALLQSAVAADPDDPDAVLAAGTLALTRHDFTAALSFAERAVELTPYRPAAYGVLTQISERVRGCRGGVSDITR